MFWLANICKERFQEERTDNYLQEVTAMLENVKNRASKDVYKNKGKPPEKRIRCRRK